jgi:hypothetical protein
MRDRCETDPARTELRQGIPYRCHGACSTKPFRPVQGSVTTRRIGKTRRFPTARDGDATWLLYSCALLLTTVP